MVEFSSKQLAFFGLFLSLLVLIVGLLNFTLNATRNDLLRENLAESKRLSELLNIL